jgi:hypothetical protein
MARGPLLVGIVTGMVLGLAPLAVAELRVCNRSAERAAVSIGYRHPQHDWVSEGWWIVPIGQCATVLRGDLGNEYYYFYALGSARGSWSGPPTQRGGDFCIPRRGRMLPLTEDRYQLIDRDYRTGPVLGGIDCEKKGGGLERKRFRIVDTGGGVRDYVIELRKELMDQPR